MQEDKSTANIINIKGLSMTYEVHTCIPYDPEGNKNLGAVYNKEMSRLKNDNDYMIFIDHDAIPTTPDWQMKIIEIINENPSVGAFTCKTNRVNCKWQLAEVDRKSNDMAYHRSEGKRVLDRFGTSVSDMTRKQLMSGVMIVLKKSVWKKIKGFKNGMLGVDNDFHKRLVKVREKLYLMNGIYLYHWYSNSDLTRSRNTNHLK